jgi:hypothetical protein
MEIITASSVHQNTTLIQIKFALKCPANAILGMKSVEYASLVTEDMRLILLELVLLIQLLLCLQLILYVKLGPITFVILVLIGLTLTPMVFAELLALIATLLMVKLENVWLVLLVMIYQLMVLVCSLLPTMPSQPI